MSIPSPPRKKICWSSEWLFQMSGRKSAWKGWCPGDNPPRIAIHDEALITTPARSYHLPIRLSSHFELRILLLALSRQIAQALGLGALPCRAKKTGSAQGVLPATDKHGDFAPRRLRHSPGMHYLNLLAYIPSDATCVSSDVVPKVAAVHSLSKWVYVAVEWACQARVGPKPEVELPRASPQSRDYLDLLRPLVFTPVFTTYNQELAYGQVELLIQVYRL